MEKIVFLTKEQVKQMIDENPNDLIPVTIVESGDSGGFEKINKKQCHIFVDQSKAIACEYGEVFNNVSLYQSIQRDITRLSRGSDVVRSLFLLNSEKARKKNKRSNFC